MSKPQREGPITAVPTEVTKISPTEHQALKGSAVHKLSPFLRPQGLFKTHREVPCKVPCDARLRIFKATLERKENFSWKKSQS